MFDTSGEQCVDDFIDKKSNSCVILYIVMNINGWPLARPDVKDSIGVSCHEASVVCHQLAQLSCRNCAQYLATTKS